MTKTKYHPVLFNTEMAQAILAGRKTQTRREIKKKYSNTDLELKNDKYGTRLIERQNDVPAPIDNGDGSVTHRMTAYAEVKPKYQIGDILWVRETWHKIFDEDSDAFLGYGYKADSEKGIWGPSIHMPKAAARIFLKVTNVRCERIAEISCEDCKKEGTSYDKQENNDVDDFYALEAFMKLWETINGVESWLQNPFVWVYDFEQVEKPADF